MKGSNLKILAAYRMYQAPEGGGEKPVRTSYLKDLDVSIGRGGGVGVPTGAQCQGQKMSGQYMSGQKLSGQNMSPLLCQGVAGRIVTSQLASSCPVVDTLHPSSKSPSHGRRIAQPTSQATTGLLKVRLASHRQRARNAIAVVDTVTDGTSRGKVSTRDDLTANTLGKPFHDDLAVNGDNLEGVTELRGRLNESVG